MAPGANAAARSAAEAPAARPRFRAEHIGGLLRPDVLEKARATKGVDPEALSGAAVSRFAERDQLGLAPRCGFSATGAGDPLTEDDQKRKLDLVVRAAEAVWGAVDG